MGERVAATSGLWFRWRRITVTVAVVVGGTSSLAATTLPEARAASPATTRTVDGRVGDWIGSTSGVGGTSQYSSGEFVYQDHLFDDLGADTGQRSQQHGTVGAPKGDFRYPTDEARYGFNAADLLELRLAADASDLWVLARLDTLKAPNSTVVVLAIDADGDASTGGGPWPYDAGLSAPGVDAVITLWGTGGSVTVLPAGSTVSLADVAVDTGNDNNAIEARVPRSLIGPASSVKVWAATGLWDAASSTWMAVPSGSPTATSPGGGSAQVASRAFNLAFRAGESGSFMESLQSDALKTGDIAPFHADVDLDALIAGEDRPFHIVPGRFYAMIFDEHVAIPPHNEGLSYTGVPGRFTGLGGAALSQTFDFYGRHQPYGLYVPSTYDGVTKQPAALALHGIGGSHSTYNSQPGFLADMGEGDGSADQPPMFLITPLARGSSFYADWGESDTLAALADVIARFPIDEERLYLTGYSMGGYGVYRLASLYPDRFASAAAWAGYTGEFAGAYLTDPRKVVGDPTGQGDAISALTKPVTTQLGVGSGRQGKANIGDPVDTLENLRHLPLVHLAGTNDEIVPTAGQYAAPRRLAELGYRSRLDLYPGYEHFSFALVDDWKNVRAWLGNRTREQAPRDVTYKFSDGWTAPGLAARLGLVHDGAWWLEGLAMREPTEDGLSLAAVSATSRALPAPAVAVGRSTSPATSPTPHAQQLVTWTLGGALPVENRLDLTLDHAGAATVDMAAASLQPCGLTVRLVSDGLATITLRGVFPAYAQVVVPAGVTSRIDASSGALKLDVAGPVDGQVAVSC
jgi:dienelactone hydrolase